MLSTSELLNEDERDVIGGMDEGELRSFLDLLKESGQHETILSYVTCHQLFGLTGSGVDLDYVLEVAEPLLWSMAEETPSFVPLAEETSSLLFMRFERTLVYQDIEGSLYWIQEAHNATDDQSEGVAKQLMKIADMTDLIESLPRLPLVKDVALQDSIIYIINDPFRRLDEMIDFFMTALQGRSVSSSQRLIFANSATWYSYEGFVNSVEKNKFITKSVQSAKMAVREASRLYAPRETRRLAMTFTHFNLGMSLYSLDKVRHDNDPERLRLAIHHLNAAEGLPKSTMKMRTWVRLNSLSDLHSKHYDQTNELAPLQLSVECGRDAIELIEEDEEAELQNRASLYLNYGSKLLALYSSNFNRELLGQAATQIEKGLIFAGPGGLEWAKLKTLHGQVYLRQYEAVGHDSSILEKGIECCNEVKNSTQSSVEVRSTVGDLLAGLLRHRYDLLQVTEDIIYAVDEATRFVDELPNDTSRVRHLDNLAMMLLRKYERQNDIDDLDHAISRIKEAMVLTPRGSHLRITVLTTFAGLMITRLQAKKDMADIGEALDAMEEVAELTSENDGKMFALINIGIHMIDLVSKSEKGDRLYSYAERVRQVCRSIIKEAQPINCVYTEQLQSMGDILMQFRGEDPNANAYTINEAISAYEKASFSELGSPSARISAAISGAKACFSLGPEKRRIADADHLLRHGVSLLRQVSPRMLQQHDQANMLRQFSGLATAATAVALEARAGSPAALRDSSAEDALCLLEEGRGIILGLLLEVRSDVSQLQKKYPELAANFIRIRDMLDEPIVSEEGGIFKTLHAAPPPLSLYVNRRAQLTHELDETVKQIRSQPGFDSFLRSPDVAEMQRAVAPVSGCRTHGIAVVVNMSQFRCDAFIVSADYPVRHIALPCLDNDAIESWATVVRNAMLASDTKFYEMLAWLWNAIVSPVLIAIRELDVERFERFQNADCTDNTELPRIWWVPTGILGAFPIHAAGPYSPNGELPNMNLDIHRYWTRTISAYSSSIKALLFMRSNMARECAENTDSKSAMLHRAPSLLVSMSETPGQQNLTFVAPEVEEVRSCLARTDGPPPTVLHEPDKATVLEGIRAGAPILHFAGHGHSDIGDPMKSALLVRDWQTDKLTVGDLQALRLHERCMPFLAYLSACSTGVNYTVDLVDEGIHPMSACQLAGFRNVVGSLWPVDDHCCQTVARAVYGAVAEASNTGADLDTAVATGLQEGVSSIRDGGGHDRGDRYAYKPGAGKPKRVRPHPRLWAGYIRIGP